MRAAVMLSALMLATANHVFGINGRPLLCVPGSDLDPLLLPYADESTNLRPGSGHSPGFGFLFSPKVVRLTIQSYVVIPGFENHPYVNPLSGTIGFLGPDDK